MEHKRAVERVALYFIDILSQILSLSGLIAVTAHHEPRVIVSARQYIKHGARPALMSESKLL